MPKLRDQERAQHAREFVEAWGNKPEKEQKECSSELKQLPSRIQSCGLGQTMAFYASKKKAPHTDIADNLVKHVTPTQTGHLQFLKTIMSGDAQQYRRWTREALAYAEWLKRYGAAILKQE